ncbi:ABC-type transport auxiliary lipoprotein family protein [Methylocystis parvus]|uniref:ABC-type transport auxiliary lipoprotein family protein n=1 Tax=Methylocystis parvus TaxID=134 RepID=UPI003C77ECC4
MLFRLWRLGEGGKMERRWAGIRLAKAGALCVALALAGCAQPPGQVFDLAGSAAITRVSATSAGGITVRPPIAVAPTSTNRIVVRDVDGSVSILPSVGWSEPLPRLLRERLIEALQRAGVAAARVSGSGRALATDIRRFEIDVARNVAVVEIYARIIDENSGAERAGQNVVGEAPAPDHTGAPAAMALTEAAGEALSRVASWARGKL